MARRSVGDRLWPHVVNYVERFGATTCVRSGGGRLHPDSLGLTVAAFRQTTSRADDPQLHTHLVISAKVQTGDGRWLALDARVLKGHQRALGGLYQSVLRAELTDRYGVALISRTVHHHRFDDGDRPTVLTRTRGTRRTLAWRVVDCSWMGSERQNETVALRALRVPIIVAIVLTLLAVAGLGVAWEWLFRRTSERSAIEETGRSATDTGRAVLDPFITDDLIAGRKQALDKLAIAGLSLIHDRGAVHVEIWSRDEKVVWADQTAVIGHSFQLETEERALFSSQGALVESKQVTLGVVTSESNLLHVDFGSKTVSGVPVMVEIDYPLSLVKSRAAQGRRSFRPVLFIGLGLLIAAQLPLLRALAQRRNTLEAQRASLVQRFITTGDAERRRIAAEVHDGAVQDLIGIALSLSVAADEVASPMKEHLEGIADSTRRTVRNLRSLLTNIYPVEVPTGGWVGGLDATVSALRQRGIVVDVDVQEIRLAPADALLMLRVGREALRNISTHAEASRVDVVMRQNGTTTTLRVTDDGVGFDEGTTARKRDAGHLGLQLLADLAEDLGARFVVNSAVGMGTSVYLELKELDDSNSVGR